ncbi:HutD/Ves family protein [Shewanella xiamenensis]|uniref:HutD/Ves family protein n=1 Tax=Shewanella xiamenensis TaxID=332186 RepID=UPI001559EA6F|nr:HutD family protein [Shewanella xiamenensis]
MKPDIQIIRYQDCESSLWKNGGGSTKQLLISPKDADLTNFDYRFSIATISSNGPFSPFPGIDRQLCILEGEGVKLMMSDNAAKSTELVLRPNQPAFCFSGETQIESQLLDKQIIDFNVMIKRGKYRAHIERLELNGSLNLTSYETSHADKVYQTKKLYNNELQQWLLCLEPMRLVYQDQMIQLKRYDMVQYRQALVPKAMSPELQSSAVEALKAKSTDVKFSKVNRTEAEKLTLISKKQTQVLRIVIECTERV